MAPYVHDADRCLGDHCPFHNPSEHHMRTWDVKVQLSRWDLRTDRLCPHGEAHPDPDNLGFLARVFGNEEAERSSVHRCDGCCRE